MLETLLGILKEIYPYLLGFVLGRLIITDWKWITNRSKRKPKNVVVTYVLHPGEVRSVFDGDWHFISAGQLANLYGLKRGTWVPYKGDGYKYSGLIHLYPREEGDYKEHLQRIQQARTTIK